MDTIRLVVSRAGGVTLDRELGDHDTELAPGGSDGPLAVRVCGVEMGMVGGLQAQVTAGYKTTHSQLQPFSHFLPVHIIRIQHNMLRTIATITHN